MFTFWRASAIVSLTVFLMGAYLSKELHSVSSAFWLVSLVTFIIAYTDDELGEEYHIMLIPAALLAASIACVTSGVPMLYVVAVMAWMWHYYLTWLAAALCADREREIEHELFMAIFLGFGIPLGGSILAYRRYREWSARRRSAVA